MTFGGGKMTYSELGEALNEYALCSLYRMMDEVEEETGKWPDWAEEVPEWIYSNFGYRRID